jgi:hypothetical protein
MTENVALAFLGLIASGRILWYLRSYLHSKNIEVTKKDELKIRIHNDCQN